MTEDRLAALVSQFPRLRIVVVGDYFLDKYLLFDPELAEVSLETGKTANQVIRIEHSPGAAGTVVSNLAALGAGLIMAVGFTGEDGEGFDLRRDLERLGCDIVHLIATPERYTPTYLKPKNCKIAGIEGEAERYDTKNREYLPKPVEQAVLHSLEALVPQADAVIIADQVEESECGVITSRVRQVLAELASRAPEVIFWADSRQRINLFENIIVKPNEREAVYAEFPGYQGELSDDVVYQAGWKLSSRTGKPVFVTRASRGILVFDKDARYEVRAVRVEEPTDPTGAGDSATAGAVLALAAGASLSEAALMANLVASVTVKCLGMTGTAEPQDLPAQLALWHAQSSVTMEE